ncbi:MAG: hypothetical protein JNG89_19640 [Planctomycetaceae bacterium]|nr:hypothetical protein [Planctomycetaceae bacterium]
MRGILGIAGAILLTGGLTPLFAAAPLEISLSESTVPGAAVGSVPGEVTEGSATFEIAPAGCGSHFAVDPSSGQLTLANAPLDFEQQSRHEFTVRVRRPRGLSGARRAYLADLVASGVEPAVLDELLFEVVEQPVIVHVTDAPDAPVLASNPLTLVVRDPAGSATEPLEIVDADSDDAHAFELVAGDQERFQVDPQTGVLTWRSGASEGGTFPLTIRVTDADGLSDAVTLNVEVLVPATVASADVPVPAGDAPVVTELPAPEQPVGEELVASSSVQVEAVPETMSEPVEAPVAVVAPVAEPVETQAAVSAEFEGTDTAPFEIVPADVEEAAGPLAASPDVEVAVAEQVPAAAMPAAGGLTPAHLVLLLVPLFLAAGAVVLLVLMRRRKRLAVVADAAPNAFRIVREARMLAPQHAPVPEATNHDSQEQSPEPKADAALKADRAAVHDLMASAFQQTAIPFAPPVPPPPPPAAVEPLAEVRNLKPLEMLEEVYRASEVAEVSAPAPLDTPEIIDEPAYAEFRADEPSAIEEPAIDPVLDSPAFATQTIDMAMLRREALGTDDVPSPSVPFNEMVATPTSDWRNQADGEPVSDFDTEPFARPAVDIDAGEATEESAPQWQIADSVPDDGMSGYDAPEDELGGYHQLRLSATSFAPTPDEIAAAEAQPDSDPGNDTINFGLSPAAHHHSTEPEDNKLQELRRQLSDLFGVSPDRPARTLDVPADEFEQPELGRNEPEVTAPEPEPVARTPEPETPAASDPSDPVNTWLAYLKQRSEGQSSAPKAAAAPIIPVMAAPVAPKPVAPPPLPVPAAAVASPQAAAVRVNKTAVREEITLLRNVANLHSRNILARRASHQRARFAWVLWGTALVVLCFGGLAALRQGPGLMRTVSMVLFAGAAVALGGCVHAFRSLNNRGEGADEDEDGVVVAEDFERTMAPELMTTEMEARLRSVMDEAPEVPVAAGEPRS